MLTLLLATLAALVPTALAQGGDEVAEEIIVYADDFARWDETRWLVQAEFLFPAGLTLARDRNDNFDTYALQVRSVIKCSKDHRLSRRKWEVSCLIEDVGVLATSIRRWRRARDRELVQRVLDEIDGKLTGLKIQLQTDFKGGITNVDLEGLTTRNQRERTIQESLRQIVSRLAAGFHLRIPDHAQRHGDWVEYNSELMRIPSISASRGSNYIKHVVSRRGDMQIVQSLGTGSSQIYVPVAHTEGIFPHPSDDASAAQSSSSSAPSLSSPEAPATGPLEAEEQSESQILRRQESTIEATWEMHAQGVAIFERETGIMSERVWVVQGVATSSSGGMGTELPPFRNAGRITQLGSADRPSVGPTKQVSPPGRNIEGLDRWVSVETMPD